LISFSVAKYTSTILQFPGKEASDEVGIYTSEKLAPHKIGTAIEIASISVSVAKLLALPVW